MTKLCTFLFLIPVFAFAQNTLPVITVSSTTVDTANHIIAINFNATDIENDMLDIKVFLSADSGKSYVAPIQLISGDFGYPVTPGNNKTVVILTMKTACIMLQMEM